jgi:hypothetical protein
MHIIDDDNTNTKLCYDDYFNLFHIYLLFVLVLYIYIISVYSTACHSNLTHLQILLRREADRQQELTRMSKAAYSGSQFIKPRLDLLAPDPNTNAGRYDYFCYLCNCYWGEYLFTVHISVSTYTYIHNVMQILIISLFFSMTNVFAQGGG